MYFIGVDECSAGRSGKSGADQFVGWLKHFDCVFQFWRQDFHSLYNYLSPVVVDFHKDGPIF